MHSLDLLPRHLERLRTNEWKALDLPNVVRREIEAMLQRRIEPRDALFTG
jgi:hypothetical protein